MEYSEDNEFNGDLDVTEDKDETYGSMLFVNNSISLDNLIDEAKQELIDSKSDDEFDESDCDSYASICFEGCQYASEEDDTSVTDVVPDYIDMAKLRKVINI